MGFLGGLFGGSTGAGFQAGQANILQPANQQQGTDAIQQQQAFLQALQAQNPAALQGQLQALQGLQGLASGAGPNPALAQLNQGTGANVAQTAALMAGQRGGSANAGLLARQAAQQGANIQQQGVGQAATLAAQQQLGGIQQLGGQASGMLGQFGNTQQNYANNVLGQINAQNSANVSNASQANSANAGVAGVNAKTQGSLLNFGAGALGSVLGMAEGGQVPESTPAVPSPTQGASPSTVTSTKGPSSNVGKWLTAGSQAMMKGNDEATQAFESGQKFGTGIHNLFTGPAQPPTPISEMSAGDQGEHGSGLLNLAGKAAMIMASKGGKIAGQARRPGNDYANDTVPAMLSPGEIVVPRSHASDPEKAAAFARAVAEKSKRKGKR